MTPREQLEPKRDENLEPKHEEHLAVSDKEAPRQTAELSHHEESASQWREPSDWDGDDRSHAVEGLDSRSLINGLGYLGIGLGLTAIVAPRLISRLTGVGDDRTGMVRMFGARELANGAAILFHHLFCLTSFQSRQCSGK